MAKSLIVYSPKFLNHEPGHRHPEVPSRLRVIMRELKKTGIIENENYSIFEPEIIDMNDLLLVHDVNYIRQIENFCKCGAGLIDARDTLLSSESFKVALLAAGGSVKAADLVFSQKYRNAFALVRPPGHHAGSNYPMGFCVFNNVAIATSYLLKNYDLSRIAILDIDAHHGNGTQDFFYDTKNVLYVSLHEDPIEFPLSGFVDETGQGEGLGYTVNIPLPYGTDDKIYLKAFNEIVSPIINQYKPQFIFVSTGFDNHYSDPIGNLLLSTLSYSKIFDSILESASNLCKGRLVAVLEGGYNLRFIGKIATIVIAKMGNFCYLFKDKHPAADVKTRKKGEKIIKQVKELQSTFWKIA